MSGGAMLNVIISIGLYPIVTRLFTKEQFGGAGLFMAVVGVISLAATSLYPSGLVIPKFKREFYGLLKLSLLLALVGVLSTTLFIISFKDFFIYIFKLDTILYIIPLIPIGVALTCIKDISVNWNVRNKDFKRNAISNIASSSSLKSMNIGYALLINPSVFGLVFSHLFSSTFAILTLGIGKMFKGINVLKRISLKESIGVGIKYKKYPLNLLPGNLINKYTSDLPIYMLTAYFSPAITGAFVLANSIMNIPLNVIGNSLASVFLQKANELYLIDPKKMSEFANRTNKKILMVGVLVFGVLFAFGDLIFAIGFGKKWTIAGQFAGILSIYYIFKLLAGPMAKVFRVVGKEQFSLYVSSVLAIARSVGIWLGVKSGDPIQAIIYFSIANLIGYAITYMFVFKACNLPIIKPLLFTILTVAVVFSMFYCIRCGIDQMFNTNSWLELSVD